MSTLIRSLAQGGTATAVVIPQKPTPLVISYRQLNLEVAGFRGKLAKLGIRPGEAVSIALPNSYEFIVSFLAATWQRAIAAPLNPAYKQEEFEFYINDLSSALIVIPRGSFEQDVPAVKAARKHHAAIAECYWDGKEVVLDIKEPGKLAGQGEQRIENAQSEDVALVLHTSGTTGRPKAVRTWETISHCGRQVNIGITRCH
jgi:oxalate---CoA ligase